MQKFTPPGKNFTLLPGKTGGTNLTSVFNVSLLYLRTRTAGYWVGNCKEVFLQRGDVQFLILPPLVNISHCLETLALGEHFVLILLFRGIINIKSDMTHLTSCKQNQKNGWKSRQSCTYNLTFWFWSSVFSISIHHAIQKEAVKSFFVFQTPRQKIWL